MTGVTSGGLSTVLDKRISVIINLYLQGPSYIVFLSECTHKRQTDVRSDRPRILGMTWSLFKPLNLTLTQHTFGEKGRDKKNQSIHTNSFHSRTHSHSQQWRERDRDQYGSKSLRTCPTRTTKYLWSEWVQIPDRETKDITTVQSLGRKIPLGGSGETGMTEGRTKRPVKRGEGGRCELTDGRTTSGTSRSQQRRNRERTEKCGTITSDISRKVSNTPVNTYGVR